MTLETNQELSPPKDNRRRVVDPTPNVLALVEANAVSARALRKADNRYYDLAMKDHKEMDAASHAHLKELIDLRAQYSKDIRTSDLSVSAQTRLVDVGGQTSSAAQLATAVLALQQTTDRNTEAQRNQLNATAATLAKQVADTATSQQLQTNAANAAMEARIVSLEKNANVGTGRQGVLDPQMADLAKAMADLVKLQAAGSGTVQGKADQISDSWKILSGVVMMILAALTIGSFIYSANRTPSTTPQIVYVPTPAPTVVSTTPK